jgi:group I intron endonuclease
VGRGEGYSNFKLEILEYCDKSNVIVREQAYIDLLSPEYNLNKTAGSRFGSKHSEETKRIISEKLKGEKNPMFGKNHSDETRKKMSDNISTSQRRPPLGGSPPAGGGEARSF